MPIAERKTAGPAPEAQPYDLGLGAADVALPRLRIVNKLTKLADVDTVPHPDDPERALARVGDLAIGDGAEDPDSIIIPRPGPIKVYVLHIHPNYGTKYGGTEGGPWEDGDLNRPSDASRQFNYMLYVPSVESIFPVLYTASSTAARAAKSMNTKLSTAALAGQPPYLFAWEISTKPNNDGVNSWHSPVFIRVEPDPDEVATAKAMHDEILGEQQSQIVSGEPVVSTEPGF